MYFCSVKKSELLSICRALQFAILPALLVIRCLKMHGSTNLNLPKQL